MTKVRIRPATEKDAKEIYWIGLDEEGAAVSPDTRFYGKKYLKDWIKNASDDSILLVAEVKKQIVGFLLANVMQKTWIMWENLAVRKGFRHQGVGSALLERLLRETKKRKIDYIGGWAREGNEEIFDFLKKRGFERGSKFFWVERKTKSLWPEHKKDLAKLKA